jgi:hypothetical protein
MIGYTHGTGKIWWLWDPLFRKIACSSDVVFDESRTPRDPGHGPVSDIIKDFLPLADIEGTEDEELESVIIRQEEADAGVAKVPMLPGDGNRVVFRPVTPSNAILVPLQRLGYSFIPTGGGMIQGSGI